MFSLNQFIMQGLKEAIGKMADYQVILNAVGWHDKGVLTNDDLSELHNLIDIKNTPPVTEEIPEEVIE